MRIAPYFYIWCTRRDSNPRSSESESDAISSFATSTYIIYNIAGLIICVGREFVNLIFRCFTIPERAARAERRRKKQPQKRFLRLPAMTDLCVLQHFQQGFLAASAYGGIRYGAVYHYNYKGYAAHHEAAGKLRLLIYIDLAYFIIGALPCKLLDGWTQSAAGRAPGRPEIYKHRLIAFNGFDIEIFVCKIDKGHGVPPFAFYSAAAAALFLLSDIL